MQRILRKSKGFFNPRGQWIGLSKNGRKKKKIIENLQSFFIIISRENIIVSGGRMKRRDCNGGEEWIGSSSLVSANKRAAVFLWRQLPRNAVQRREKNARSAFRVARRCRRRVCRNNPCCCRRASLMARDGRGNSMRRVRSIKQSKSPRMRDAPGAANTGRTTAAAVSGQNVVVSARRTFGVVDLRPDS